MSVQLFLATAKPLQKTVYKYKDILPTIAPGDTFYSKGISFDSNLSDAEKLAIGNIFDQFCCYAIRSEFKLDYEPRFRHVLSEKYAINSLEELKWFRSFAKKKIFQQDVFMLIKLCLGHRTNFNAICTETIDVNNWELSDEKSWEFDYGVVYQFIDNSEEAIKKRMQKMQNLNQ